jgi:thioredoxin 1
LVNDSEEAVMATITITKENFDSEVMRSDKPVLLDFWAGWCVPCRMMSPVVDKVADERPDYKVGKVNVDEQSELAQRFGVMGIPTLAVVRNGKVESQSSGARPKGKVLELLG